MREMGERIGRPHSFVQKVEVGERRLDVVEFIWYCEALGVQPQTGMNIVQNHRLRLKKLFNFLFKLKIYYIFFPSIRP